MRRQWLAGLVAVVALPALTWSAAGALPEGASTEGAAKVAAPLPGEPGHAHKCTQQDAGRSEHDEFATCLGVRARLVSAPGLGETARLEVTVLADADRPGALVDVELPKGWEFADAGRAAVRSVRSSDGTGTASRARLGMDVREGAAQRVSYLVRPGVAGAAHIQVRVHAEVSDGHTDAGSADVFVTVGRGGRPSRLGASPAPTLSAAAPVPKGARLAVPEMVRTTEGPAKGVTVASTVRPFSDDPKPAGAAAPSGQSCISGGYFFVDQAGVTRPAWNQVFYVWDQDSLTGDDLLTSGTVNGSGSYSACVSNNDGEGDSTQEIYVQFRTENSKWKVRDTAASNQVYRIVTSMWDACNACDHSYGNLQAADSTLMRGMNAFEGLNRLWQFVQGGSAGCFDRSDTTCRQMVLNWTTTSTDGTYYSLGGNDIHLAANDPNAPHVTIHEGAHALMDDVYEDTYPPFPNCSPHFVAGTSSTGCAWTEGFAEWIPAMVLADPFFRWPSGAALDLETPSWGAASWNEGDAVEGRVAGAMIDLSDSTQDVPWDYAAEGGSRTSRQYSTFINTYSTTFADFILSDRVAQGHPVTDVELGSIFQSSIDYDFRDPLSSQVPRARAINALRNLNYGFTAGSNYWSVVGIRPPAGADSDIVLYSDRLLTTVVSGSSAAADVIDFVGIDRNGLAASPFYASIVRYSGANSHDIEFVQSTSTLPNGSVARSFGTTDVADIVDSNHTTGVRVYYRLVPAATLDADLFLLRATNASRVVGRLGASAASTNAGAGVAETMNYADVATRFNGVVVARRSGSGSYTIYRDTTAPTGSVSIGIGNPASINSLATALQVSVTDAETGLLDMRVSTDGALDSEPWEPTTGTKSITLPSGGAGNRSVTVEVRNRAGMTATFSDTVYYDTRPNLVASASAGAISVYRGQSFGLTSTTSNTGPTAAGASTTRYYLSTDTVRSAGDTQLGGSDAVPLLGVAGTDVSAVTVTVPTTAPGGVLYLLACADDTAAVAEFSETDNCTAARDRVSVRGVDLRVSQLGSPPVTRAKGTSFAMNVTTSNIGLDPSVATATRFVLSLDGVWSTGDVRLSGGQAVPALAGGGSSAGNPILGIPATTPPGVYRVIACADAAKVQTELDEANNCMATRATITVT